MGVERAFYPELRFGGFTRVDGTIAFYTRVNGLVDGSTVLLDVGCGRGAFMEDPVSLRRELRLFQRKCRRVIGIDVDPAAREHPGLDEFLLIDGPRWPIPDEEIDVCVGDFVLEHVEVPDAFFAECRRVLKPGGYLCIRTSNAHGYVGILSKIVPERYHTALLRKAQRHRNEADIFHTFYRCNTKARISHMLRRHGFDHCVYGYEAEPSYLSCSPLLYRLGVLHQRFAPNGMKVTIFAFGRKIECVRPGEICEQSSRLSGHPLLEPMTDAPSSQYCHRCKG